MLNNFIKSGLKIATPVISASIVAKTDNHPAGQVLSNVLKSLTGGRIWSLTDMHDNGLGLKVM